MQNHGRAVIGGNVGVEAARRSQVQEQIDRLESVTSRLYDTASAVEKRFGSALSNVPPCAPEEGKPPQALCELAQCIQERIVRLEGVEGILRNILQRCELP